jgi:hypothetical protein
MSAYLIHYVEKSSECKGKSGYVVGFLALLLVFGFGFSILLGLSEYFSRNDMAKLNHKTASSQKLPLSNTVTFAIGVFQFGLSLLFVLTVRDSSDEVSFICHKSWFNHQSLLFIFTYHMFLHVIALQSVLYTKHCESWMYIYETTKNQHDFPDSGYYKISMAVFIISLFLVMPFMSTLFQHAIFDNWSDFNSLPKALYLATLFVSFIYGVIPLLASAAVKKSKSGIPYGKSPFGLSKRYVIALAILQAPITLILSQAINASEKS